MVTIRQTQQADWPAFRLPLDIEFEVGDDAERSRIEVTGREQTFRIPLDAAPAKTTLDPEGHLLMRTGGS